MLPRRNNQQKPSASQNKLEKKHVLLLDHPSQWKLAITATLWCALKVHESAPWRFCWPMEELQFSAAQLYQHDSAYNYNYSGISSCHLLPSQLLEAVAHGQSACATTASPWRQCAGEAPADSARCSGDGWGWLPGSFQSYSDTGDTIPHHRPQHSNILQVYPNL